MAEPLVRAARLTPPGAAALAVLGLHGAGVRDLLATRFRRQKTGPLTPDRPHYGWFGDGVQDDVVLWISGSGDYAEVYCHGGVAMSEALLADAAKSGVQVVDWRTFETACGGSACYVEALAALAEADAERSAAILLDQLTALDAALAAAECDPEVAREALRWAEFGRRLVRPPTVVLFGEPNVGKSSLMNALAGFTRAIVAPQPGTTRDVLRQRIAVGGFAVDLIDGAGLREAEEAIEAAGVEKLRATLTGADLRILVLDASQDSDSSFAAEGSPPPDLLVANKVDLGDRSSDSSALRTSATTGVGVEELRGQIEAHLFPEIPSVGAAVPFTERQCELLRRLASRS